MKKYEIFECSVGQGIILKKGKCLVLKRHGRGGKKPFVLDFDTLDGVSTANLSKLPYAVKLAFASILTMQGVEHDVNNLI